MSSAESRKAFRTIFGPMTISTGYGYDIARYAEDQRQLLYAWTEGAKWAIKNRMTLMRKKKKGRKGGY